jgi:cell division protein FtsL
MSQAREAFLPLWTLAVAATVSAFVLHLALRGRSMQLGYELGKARQEQSRLREVERVMQLEAASYKTPERVEIVARTLLGMEPPSPDRIVSLGPGPSVVVERAMPSGPPSLLGERAQARLDPLSAPPAVPQPGGHEPNQAVVPP